MSSHSDIVSVYLICMAREERGREGDEEGKKKGWREEEADRIKVGKKCLQKRLEHAMSWLTVNFLEVSIVQRTFEMAHLTALYSTPSRCLHLHTSYQMKMDGENQCHWDERFIKVTLSSKLLKPLYLVSVIGILTYQHNLFTAEAGAMWIYQQRTRWQGRPAAF